MRSEIRLPALTQGMESGEIVEWIKAQGDIVQRGEPIAVIQTDKANVELEATADGILADIVHRVGEELAVGTVIAYIEHIEDTGGNDA
jgi:pyruvate/2-oxoglutarate dehydrogenase complex dihydrolipoamide acyltransferase (E2) component